MNFFRMKTSSSNLARRCKWLRNIIFSNGYELTQKMRDALMYRSAGGSLLPQVGEATWP
jgi:hypothetical protein